MISFSIIQKSQLEGALRLDAEYYQPEYLELESKLRSFQIFKIGEISEVVYGTTPTGGIFEENGIPFIRSQNFSALSINDDFVFCSKDFHKQNQKSKVEIGNILFAAVGATIGQLAVVQDEIQEANINQNIAAVKIKDKRFNPYFVGLFFASRFGQLQIERLVTGNAQFYLNSEQIKNFIIPLLRRELQNKVATVFKDAQKELQKSKFLYSQAEDLLLEELGLKDFEFRDDLSYVVNFSDIIFANRIDAEFFQPKYKEIKSKIKNFEFKKLGDIVSIKKGVEPGSAIYQEGGIPFFRVSNVSKFGIKDNNQQYLSQEIYSKFRNNFKPETGEILLTKDATPGIAYYLDDKLEGIISGGILRLKPRIKIEPEYLTLAINSVIGQMQAEQDTGGSIIVHWRPEQIKSCLIPILPKPTQQKIADLVQQSHATRKKAKQLLEQAKQKVENLIRKG